MARLLAIYRPYLSEWAGQMVPDVLRARVDASDLVQDTLLRCATQIDQFQGTTQQEFTAWVRQILHNLVVDWVRHNTREKRDVRREVAAGHSPPSPEKSPSQILGDKESLERVSAALSQLPEEQRRAVEWRSQGENFQTIGERLNRSPDSARMLWGRAIARLLKALKDDK